MNKLKCEFWTFSFLNTMKFLVIILVGCWSKISQGGGGCAGGIWTHYLSISKVLAMAPLPETCACVYLIGQYR